MKTRLLSGPAINPTICFQIHVFVSCAACRLWGLINSQTSTMLCRNHSERIAKGKKG